MDLSKQFVIVSHVHFGAKHLAQLLGTHEQIKMFGNLFNRSDYEVMSELETQGTLIPVAADPVEYLQSKLFLGVPKNIAVAGFVLHYDEAQKGPWLKLWSFLRKNLKIIHLKRRNRLGAFLGPSAGSMENIVVDIFEFENFVATIGSVETDHDTLFRYSEVLDVFWEDLVNAEEIVRIEDFLGVDQRQLEFPVNDDYTGRLENRDELVDYFKNTSLGAYF